MQREPAPVPAPQDISEVVLREKYCKGDERSEAEVFARVARALASVEAPALQGEWQARFLANLQAGAIGAGRIMSAAGSGLDATLINCFVQPVGDSIQGRDDEGQPGIYEALREAAETLRRGGGVGYDFSRIRPHGAHVGGTGSVASGPCSYMDVFDRSCATVESAGARRGAQMGVLRIDHPDIQAFVAAKHDPARWRNFNVSVGVPDAFMQALAAGADWPLVHRARPGPAQLAAGAHQREDGLWVYRHLPARTLWDEVMRSTYDTAEPGVLFLDAIARDNNLAYCEQIAATNPCGEQPLPAYGCCDLGPLILPRFVRHPFGLDGVAQFDFAAFEQAVAVQVRALDNVLALSFWPLPQQREEAMAKRRIGVGFTGLGNTLAMLGLRYDNDAGRAMAARIARHMRDAAYRASVALAQEKGPFAAFRAEGYLRPGSFASRLDAPLREAIAKHGIRNSHLLSIAPTGTVSLAFADNASNGIEPPFAWTYRRHKREPDGSTTVYQVQDHAFRLWRSLAGEEAPLPPAFVSALELAPADHLAMVAAVQPFIDTGISKTVNVPADCPWESFQDLYRTAWASGLKGLSTYRPSAGRGAVLETAQAAPDEPASDPMRAVIARRPPGALPAVAEKIEYWTREGRQTLYLLVSFLPVEGGRERAIEFFMPVGQRSESQQWISACMRMLSLAARGGFLERALSDMRKVAWDQGPVRLGTLRRADGTEVPRWHDSEVAAIAYAVQNIIARRSDASVPGLATPEPAPSVVAADAGGRRCPECGAHALVRRDGCDWCGQCGYLGSCG
ncbi:adenosylcobalamin-dependent ribonucleoside-diphosphate reductase [Ramlibacter rhizophilus]|uniref:Vitamin B12-dependent ribonucleotide reductase n=1 Tax=Ramlibacter rhizophilus TaxID=1781167 RepID=A0A4Z0BSP3_9BURK|nr:adenosylcobalamin-dependent ribonucleoside-diphosphate reductase [Ramlibacter rhizophilus]TFZ01484.1 adenosylcobalamin-dependent ribonucleoside-diphosphate reductase [Ramlibacter rhizophilus]